MAKKAKTGYRVEQLIWTGGYVAWTSPCHPVTREMAESYADFLELRSNTGGRIIDNATGEVVKTWGGMFKPREDAK